MPARSVCLNFTQQYERFQATRLTYEGGVKGGLLKGQVLPGHGDTGRSLVELALMVEECYTVEPSAALTIFATGPGLTPLNMASTPEYAEFFAPFLSCKRAPLASLVFSEPGGDTNALEEEGPCFQTMARRDGDKCIINGEKI